MKKLYLSTSFPVTSALFSSMFPSYPHHSKSFNVFHFNLTRFSKLWNKSISFKTASKSFPGGTGGVCPVGRHCHGDPCRCGHHDPNTPHCGLHHQAFARVSREDYLEGGNSLWWQWQPHTHQLYLSPSQEPLGKWWAHSGLAVPGVVSVVATVPLAGPSLHKVVLQLVAGPRQAHRMVVTHQSHKESQYYIFQY